MQYEPDYSRNQIHFLAQRPEWLPRLEKVGRPRAILDLGAGGGRNIACLQKVFPDATVTALDVSHIRCTLCRRTADVGVVCGDAVRLPFQDAVFDLVLSTQVIEHVPDDHTFVIEATRVLRRDGQMIVSSVLRLPRGWYFHRRGGRWVLDPTHEREYESEAEFASLFDRSLRILETAIEPVQFSPARFVYRALARRGVVGPPDPGFFARTALTGALEKWGLPVPGYRIITVVAQKV